MKIVSSGIFLMAILSLAGCTSTPPPEFPPELAYTPPSGALQGPGREGPWNGRLMIAISEDGLTFTRTNLVITDQADVPDVAMSDDGTLYVYYTGWTVGEKENETAVAVSTDGGTTWEHYQLELEGVEGYGDPVDPDIQILSDGTFRLYMTTQGRGEAKPHTVRFESDDGFHFTLMGSVFEGEEDGNPVLDPSSLVVEETWHLFAGGTPQTNYHAISDDGGETFELIGYVNEEGCDAFPCVMSNGLAVEDGYRYYAFGKTAIYSLWSEDGTTWELEDGARLEVDETSGLESESVKDAAVVRLPDGRYLMVYKTTIPGSVSDFEGAP